MPIYEYKCRKCDTTFEMLQNMNEDNSKIQCPQCQTDKPDRILSLFSSAPTGSKGVMCGPDSFS